MFIPVLLLALLGGLFIYTVIRCRRIAARFPPSGRFSSGRPGSRLHFVAEGLDGGGGTLPVLVFLHGASGNLHDQKLAFDGKLEARFPRLFIDRPGLGYSERQLRADASPKAQAMRIAALLDELAITNAIVVGHSLGAATAAALGLLRPDVVKGLVFVAPATHPWPGGVNWYYNLASWPVIGAVFCRTLALPAAERLTSPAIGNVFKPDPAPRDYVSAAALPLLFRPASFRANAVDVARLKPHLIEQSVQYPAMKQPAVIVTGDKDAVVWPSIHSEGLKRDLRDAELHVLEGAGHMPHHTHAAQVAHLISGLAGKLEQQTEVRAEEHQVI
ncbi:alpha/beta hydrolase [Roseibium sp. RKSG952]|nr:alpha/beta hydrolase [Roseibium sp. RKSG952]